MSVFGASVSVYGSRRGGGPLRAVAAAGPTPSRLAFLNDRARVAELVRRCGLKIHCPSRHEGSNPSPGIPPSAIAAGVGQPDAARSRSHSGARSRT